MYIKSIYLNTFVCVLFILSRLQCVPILLASRALQSLSSHAHSAELKLRKQDRINCIRAIIMNGEKRRHEQEYVNELGISKIKDGFIMQKQSSGLL